MAPEEPQSPPPAPPAPPIRYAVTAPGAVSGGVMGVGFANGHGVITDAARHARALAWFEAEPGYRVERLDEPEPLPEVTPEAPGDAEDADDEAADEAAEDTEEGPEWL
ncbi:hypothetical protein [Streptomyces sp. NPDC059949]|uniref:hypothetical protein n=1 Tax=Streptomyces sp. NPDC059949 TaxID=3347013 RepID=UPI00364EAA20